MFPSQRGSNDLGAATLPYFDLATYLYSQKGQG